MPSRSESTPKREEMDKAAVEAYLETHQINAALQESINAAVKAQSPDPKAHMGATLLSLSKHACGSRTQLSRSCRKPALVASQC